RDPRRAGQGSDARFARSAARGTIRAAAGGPRTRDRPGSAGYLAGSGLARRPTRGDGRVGSGPDATSVRARSRPSAGAPRRPDWGRRARGEHSAADGARLRMARADAGMAKPRSIDRTQSLPQCKVHARVVTACRPRAARPRPRLRVATGLVTL